MPKSQYLKSIIAFVMTVVSGIVGGGIAQGLINGAAAAWATIVIGTVTTALVTAGVFYAKNQPSTAAIQQPAKSSNIP